MFPPSTNRPLAPGAIIGYLRNGTPIRLIAGGSGDGDGDATTTSQDGSAGAGQTDTSTGQTGGQEPPAATTTGTASAAAGDGDQAAKVIAAVREDYKQERAKRQQLEQDLAAIKAAQDQQAEETKARNLALAKALGLAADEPPDPEKLAADLAAAREQTQAEISKREARERELTIELQLIRQAGKHGANPELLADSRSFMAKVARLDPSADDFGDDLGTVIKAAVEANPAYKLAQPAAAQPPAAAQGNGQASGQPANGNGAKTTAPPARSSASHDGAAGGNRQWTIDDVNRLPKNRAGARELQEAIDAGLLADLGYGPGKKSRR